MLKATRTPAMSANIGKSHEAFTTERATHPVKAECYSRMLIGERW
jgi:hypothetical protein